MIKEIGGRVVIFDSNTHRYTVGGQEVIGVTTMIKKVLFADKYSGVSDEVLEKARKFGSQIHNAIEFDEPLFLTDLQRKKYDEFWEIVKKNEIEILEKEQIVYYVKNDKVLFIGTLDLIMLWRDLLSIGDIKTTYNLDSEYLSWQLGFYKLAYEQLYNKKLLKALAVWLPKRKKGTLHNIEPKSEKEVLWLVGEYGKIIQAE